MLKLDKTVRSFYLQFSFSNEKAVPAWLPMQEEETPAEAKARRERKTHGTGMGVCVIEPAENCSIETLLDEIVSAGFTLVNAYYQPRVDPNNPRKCWYMARYIFVRNEDVTRDELGESREMIEVGLKDICLLAFWRVRAWRNPFFKDGEPVEGLSAASVNLEARKPRYQPNGQPVVAWRRDYAGNRVGTAPKPLAAAHYLRVKGNTLQLTDE